MAAHPKTISRRPPVLSVVDLSVRRGRVRILTQVSWQVRPGEHWVILGANGSGKTSLLAAVTGYLTPSDGEIKLLGRRYGHFDWGELRRRTGLVSSTIRQMMADDEPALETVISGKSAQIDRWGPILRRDQLAARRILQKVECDHLANRPWRVLSQGERQRVLIGRALMARPRLLILDEPCAGLDPAAREHFLQFLQRLGHARHSPTLILVTHHVEEIMPVFSHVLLLKAGRVLAAGTKQAVLRSPMLRATFAAELRVTRMRGRFALRVAPKAQGVI